MSTATLEKDNKVKIPAKALREANLSTGARFEVAVSNEGTIYLQPLSKPNAETEKALEESRSGRGKLFKTKAALMADLKS